MIGVLGGTFDPVHIGHLRLAVEMREALGMDPVRLVVSARPPHRPPPVASAEDRLALLGAALAACPGLVADARELSRPGPSYTVDTLASLRAEHPREPLVLILGMDAFAGLASWHRWREIYAFAHIALARRPGATDPRHGAVAELLRERRVDQLRPLRARPNGHIYVQDIPSLEISATRVRALVGARRDPCFLIPDPVSRLIAERDLYIAEQ